MGRRNPERSALTGHDSDRLAAYLDGYQVQVWCEAANCLNARSIHVAQMMRRLGEQATIADLRRRLRCSRCNGRKAAVRVRFVGHGPPPGRLNL